MERDMQEESKAIEMENSAMRRGEYGEEMQGGQL